MWRKEKTVHCWWECKLVQSLWKAVERVLNKVKVDYHTNRAILHLCIYMTVKVKVLAAQSYLTLCNPMDYSLPGFSVLRILQGVSCHSLLQGILLTQGWNLSLPHCGQIFFTFWATKEACVSMYFHIYYILYIWYNVIHIMGYYSVKRNENLAICSNTEGPWRQYAKWNKSGRERQIT